MSETTAVQSTSASVRMLPLSAINVADGFNPRHDVDPKEQQRLERSIERHGVLQPLLVAPAGDGEYQLIAGWRRLTAAAKVGLMELPALIRDPGDDSDRLAFAVLENDAHVDLNPLEEAKAFRRLLGAGLTKRGVAEQLSVSQKRVTERLAILDVPEELHAKIAGGSIPTSAIKPLVTLARVHPGLPLVAVQRIEQQPPTNAYYWEPTTYADLVADPFAVVCGRVDGDAAQLPDDVYEVGCHYPISRFGLDDKRQRDLVKLAGLLGIDPDSYRFFLSVDEAEQARTLGAVHPADRTGYGVLIVGQEVADQIAGDHIKKALKQQRDTPRRLANVAVARGDDAGAGDESSAPEPMSEEELREQRRQEREQQQELRRAAVAHNYELGAAVYSRLSRLKVDDRLVKVLAAVDLHGDLDKIAARGARYGFPDWPQEVEQKSGKTRTEYLSATDAGVRARDFLAGAKTAADYAGRCFALIAMAHYASEEAVAQSSRSFYTLSVRGPDWSGTAKGLPWGDEVLDLVDEIAAERLPDHLTAIVRGRRREQREERERRAHEKQQREQATDELIASLPGMAPAERQAAVDAWQQDEDACDAAYDWRRRERVREALQELAGQDAAAEPVGGE